MAVSLVIPAWYLHIILESHYKEIVHAFGYSYYNSLINRNFIIFKIIQILLKITQIYILMRPKSLRKINVTIIFIHSYYRVGFEVVFCFNLGFKFLSLLFSEV